MFSGLVFFVVVFLEKLKDFLQEGHKSLFWCNIMLIAHVLQEFFLVSALVIKYIFWQLK